MNLQQNNIFLTLIFIIVSTLATGFNLQAQELTARKHGTVLEQLEQ